MQLLQTFFVWQKIKEENEPVAFILIMLYENLFGNMNLNSVFIYLRRVNVKA